MGTFSAQGPQEVTIRQCGARFPEQCITEDSGYFFVTLCSCDTDNCNKELKTCYAIVLELDFDNAGVSLDFTWNDSSIS